MHVFGGPAMCRLNVIVIQIAWLAVSELVLFAGVESSGPDFRRDVVPILERACWKCHGQNEREAELDLRTGSAMRVGGEGGPAIVDGPAGGSLLLQRMIDGTMPPEDEPRLSLDEIQVIRLWLDAGAPTSSYAAADPSVTAPLVTDEDREYYAFRQLVRPRLPGVVQRERVRTAIDHFVLARLEEQHLGYSADADRQTLLRRACFDLLGLPPSSGDGDGFVKDSSPLAYQRLLDRLLASPHFGERWGRHWLDVAGYVDVYGSDENASSIRLPPGGWKYRDYVIQSFNRDKPFDRFLTEQIAGDELVDWRRMPELTEPTKDMLIATGFLRTAIDDTDQGVLNIPSNRYAVLFDQMEIFGSSVFGLTLQCARCHSHKYDPIPARDYYRLMANFIPAYNPGDWMTLKNRKIADVGLVQQQQMDAHNAQCDEQIKPLQARIDELHQAAQEEVLAERLQALPDDLQDDAREAFLTDKDKRDDAQKELVERAGEISDEEVEANLDEGERARIAELRGQIEQVDSTRQAYGWIYALFDTGPPPETRQLIRGQFERPGRPVQNGFLSVLCSSEGTALAAPTEPVGETSGRRRALAEWLTSREVPASGLVARVMVNRLWHHLFGRGIVATPGNLGRSGDPPTHPDLLDWLASESIDSDWRQKVLLRRMMTSTVYRQTSHAELATSSGTDPENNLLWKMRLKRLEAEVIRDRMLAASGKLDRTPGGPPVPLEVLDGGRTIVAKNDQPTPSSRSRRSIYLTSRRNYHVSMLGVFDIPAMTTNCTIRDRSTVVLQSLAMMNDEFSLAQADEVAHRIQAAANSVESDQPQDSTRLVKRAFQLVLNRAPSPDESRWATEFLRQQASNFVAANQPSEENADRALSAMCQMLFNTNEFLYVE